MIRLNKFLAHQTGISRREADDAISSGRVFINGKKAAIGSQIDDTSTIALDGQQISHETSHLTILLNKPVGYVSSRSSQSGSKNKNETIYALLPTEFKKLKPVGRLDKDSSGLLLMTTDGDFAFQMTHPKFHKTKSYLVSIKPALSPLHQQMISDFGVNLDDGKSQLNLEKISDNRLNWRVSMHEGRNRQIRRTFASLGYEVTKLHRTDFGNFSLGNLEPGNWQEVYINQKTS